MSHAQHDETGFRRLSVRIDRAVFTGRCRPQVLPWIPVVGEKCPFCHGYGSDPGGPSPWRCSECDGVGLWPAGKQGEYIVDITIDKMLGRTIRSIEGREGDDALTFRMEDGSTIRMEHQQGCCEQVYLAEVVGDLRDLIGLPLFMAEEVSSEAEPAQDKDDYSFTWTFYKLATSRGNVTLRWYGSSNGWYSEDVDLVETLPRKDA